MARDIEEFLRKAAERRAAQQQGQRGGAQPASAQPSPPRQPPPVARQAEVNRPVVQPRTIEAGGFDAPDEPDPFPSGQSVAEHVQKHIDAGSSEIAQQTRKLGERVGQTGKKVKDRVQQKFDHEVGNLAESQSRGEQKKGKPTDPKSQVPTARLAPQTIAELLRSPQALRQSIIIAELLKRPEWD